MTEALSLRGELDRKALERAINAIVERHESLRTHFEEVEGQPFQVIEPVLQIEMPSEDLSELREEARWRRVKAEMGRESRQAFNLEHGPILRIRLLKLGEQEHVLLLTVHHIASDRWSLGVFNRELKVRCTTCTVTGQDNALKPLVVQYADFAILAETVSEGKELSEGLAYWQKQLEGILGASGITSLDQRNGQQFKRLVPTRLPSNLNTERCSSVWARRLKQLCTCLC